VVGRGGGSEVFKEEMYDRRLVAVKRLNQGPQAEKEFLTDIEINTSLSHIHIVSLLGYCVDSSHIIFVYDFLPKENLEDHPHGKHPKFLNVSPKWTNFVKFFQGFATKIYLGCNC